MATISHILTANRTPSSQSNVKIAEYRDFKGGLNTINKGINLKPYEVPDILNMQYFQSPWGVGVESRPGLDRVTSSAVGTSITDIAYYVDASGGDHTLAFAGTTLYQVNTSGTTVALAPLAQLEGTRCRMAPLANKMVLADGAILKQLSGTTVTACYDSSLGMFDTTGSLDASTAASYLSFGPTTSRIGQKVTLPSWASDNKWYMPVETCKFHLHRTGSLSGNVTPRIYSASGATLLFSGTSREANAFTSNANGDLYEFTFSGTTWHQGGTYIVSLDYALADTTNLLSLHYSGTTLHNGSVMSYAGAWAATTGTARWLVTPKYAHSASILETRTNRLWSNDTDPARKNWLRYSNLNDPNDWNTTDGSGYFIMENGFEITALKNFYNVLFIHFGSGYKQLFQLSGDTPDDFAISRVISGSGAINQDVVWNVSNDFLYLDSAGVFSMIAWQNYGNFKQALRSDPIQNIVVPYVNSGCFAGYNSAAQQYWLYTGQGYLLVYDVNFGIWTKFEFELGTGVNITALAEWNGVSYVGTSDGHIWKMDAQTADYDDNGTDYTQKIKTRWEDFKVMRDKHARFCNVQALSRQGGSFLVNFYRDLGSTAFTSVAINIPFDSDLTLAEATFSLGDSIQTMSPVRNVYHQNPVEFEFKALQIAVENIENLDTPLQIFGVSVDVAVLSRAG